MGRTAGTERTLGGREAELLVRWGGGRMGSMQMR